jgi:hypothetical protein
MPEDPHKYTQLQVPVLIGQNYEHVMCHATIYEEGDTITITMSARGSDAAQIAAAMTEGELLALSFVAIPARPRNTDT